MADAITWKAIIGGLKLAVDTTPLTAPEVHDAWVITISTN